MKRDIYNIALQCKNIIDTQIEVSRNKVVVNNFIFYDHDISGDINNLKSALKKLVACIKNKYKSISKLLQKHIEQYDSDRIIHFSAIEAIINTIIALEENTINAKKIFISHAHIDKDIIKNFSDHILQLGIGINSEDIFCTSIEEMGIRNGEDIRKHIQKNIRTVDYAFLMISKNYKKSGICVNEMGAVWAYDSNVRLYLLPDVDFKNIGWLCDTKKADKLNESVTLDALQKELTEYFGLPDKEIAWSRQRETFLEYINKK